MDDHSSPLTLRRFPREVRELIFKDCVDWYGKTPAIIVALRGDKELYEEAIDIFYEANAFVLHKGNMNIRNMMSKNAWLSVKKLKVNLSAIEKCGQGEPGPTMSYEFTRAVNVREVELNCDFDSDLLVITRITAIEILFKRLRSSSLKKVSLHMPAIESNSLPPLAFDRRPGLFILYLNHVFRTAAKLNAVDVELPLSTALPERISNRIAGSRMLNLESWRREPRTWFWQAEEGEFLKMKSERLLY